jgi:hypothetical protein
MHKFSEPIKGKNVLTKVKEFNKTNSKHYHTIYFEKRRPESSCRRS